MKQAERTGEERRKVEHQHALRKSVTSRSQTVISQVISTFLLLSLTHSICFLKPSTSDQWPETPIPTTHSHKRSSNLFLNNQGTVTSVWNKKGVRKNEQQKDIREKKLKRNKIRKNVVRFLQARELGEECQELYRELS